MVKVVPLEGEEEEEEGEEGGRRRRRRRRRRREYLFLHEHAQREGHMSTK